MSINFSDVPAASANEYLEPGMYRLSVDKEGTKVVTENVKSPYLQVRFVAANGASVTEKFFLTAKALPRLQYLHEAWFNKRLERSFDSFKDIGEYFKAGLTAKIVSRPMVTGGKITADGKFYSGLPYSGFVIMSEADFEEGPFEKDSVRYKNAVRIEKPNAAVAGTDAALLPGTDIPTTGSLPDGADSPW
jgi:hypothetical protein